LKFNTWVGIGFSRKFKMAARGSFSMITMEMEILGNRGIHMWSLGDQVIYFQLAEHVLEFLKSMNHE
jgi:hypothetical protein